MTGIAFGDGVTGGMFGFGDGVTGLGLLFFLFCVFCFCIFFLLFGCFYEIVFFFTLESQVWH